MKKLIVFIMAIIMTASVFGCGTKTEVESREDETLRIMTSYIGVEDNSEGTEFEFDTHEAAEDFMYYWLDYDQTVSGIIWRESTGNYYVTIAGEEHFDDVCREVLNSYGGYEAAWGRR